MEHRRTQLTINKGKDNIMPKTLKQVKEETESKMSTVEKIAIMQAYVDGKTIEYFYKEGKIWDECSFPSWNWLAFNYRVKPEPKKIHSPYSTRFNRRIGLVCRSKAWRILDKV